ncbi:MAG: N-acyl-D-amino-acid deacylase family protein [Acidimicrobiales bacterium]
MAYDLVIRNGTVVDGSGAPRRRADVAVAGDRIVDVGRVGEHGQREIDAEGLVVTPGFVDGHTHMDAQVFWDPLGTNSCWHGVTTVVMGNCGFSLAPSHRGAEHLVLDNLQRAEDIPAEALTAGVDWDWESFPQYLDAVDRAPKAINYVAQVGHSALRTAVMGERAFGAQATEADLAGMAALLSEALEAGAVGFTTSISDHHVTPDGRPVASRSTSWPELTVLVGEARGGVFELAVDTERAESGDRERALSFYDQLRALAVATGVPTSYGLRRDFVHEQLDSMERAGAEGGDVFGQCQAVTSTTLWSFATRMPADVERLIPLWLSDRRTVEELAHLRGVGPADVLTELDVETGGTGVFGVADTPAQEESLLVALRHPRTVMTFGDAGAHVTAISGADQQTTLLSKWVRERGAFSLEEAVRMITLVPALRWRIPDRGLVRAGMVADLNVLDPRVVGPGVPWVAADLPAGAKRIVQRAVGFRATVVAGVETLASGEPTGALPGRLLRGATRDRARR